MVHSWGCNAYRQGKPAIDEGMVTFNIAMESGTSNSMICRSFYWWCSKWFSRAMLNYHRLVVHQNCLEQWQWMIMMLLLTANGNNTFNADDTDNSKESSWSPSSSSSSLSFTEPIGTPQWWDPGMMEPSFPWISLAMGFLQWEEYGSSMGTGVRTKNTLTSYFIIILMFIVILIWLVAWNMFYFSIYWEYLGISSSQVTFIFFKWVKTTNQSSILIILYPLVN